MSEADVVHDTPAPITLNSLGEDLEKLGIAPGMVLLVHSSLSALGWVCGGPVAVILALERVLRSYGTLIMPAHSGGLSDPAQWENPAVPQSWWNTIRDHMPPFDPDMTPSRGMGAVAECFRSQKDVLRSEHPQVSFAAWGERALEILQNHRLDFSLGEDSPLARIYDLDGWVLFMGVSYGCNTSFHLAEYRASFAKKQTVASHAPIMANQHRKWQQFQDINYDCSDFELLGRDFTRSHKAQIKTGQVGRAKAQLFRQRLCVDYAVRWMERKRK